jgi:hypothetical protein
MNKRAAAFQSFIKALALLPLLSLYLLGATELSGVHEFIHSDEHVSHSNADEANACHRAVFHNEKEACSHKTHVTQKSECSLCDHVPSNDATIHSARCEYLKSLSLAHHTVLFASKATTSTSLLPARAPPAC